jgi:MFS family permease
VVVVVSRRLLDRPRTAAVCWVSYLLTGGEPVKRSALVLFTVCTACLLMPFAMAGVSVALPGIGTGLHAGLAPVQWVVNGYDLAFGSLMLAFGSLADLFGRRRIFTVGVATFAVASLLGALAGNVVLLDLARALAGAGAAATITSGSALLAEAFEGPARVRAFGVFGTVVGLGLAFGATLAGVLVDTFGWRSVFAVPAAVGGGLLLLTRALPESRNPAARRVDAGGTLTFTGALGLLIFALIEGPQTGWTRPEVVGGFAGFAALIVAFVAVERRAAEPMFDLALLRQRRFVGLCLAVMAFVAVFTPLAMDLPSYLIATGGIGARQAGGWMMMLGVPTLVLPAVAAYLTRWIPARHQVVATLLLSGGGAAWLTEIRPGGGAMAILGPLALIGTGIGISFGLLDNLAVSSVEPARAGMAAGMFNTTRIGGETIAIAVIGSLLVSFTASRLGDGGAADLLNQGDLTGAVARGVPASAAASAYTGALRTVCGLLAALCALAAPAVAALLREGRTTPEPRPAPVAERAVA